jgi:microcystin degradation protein MlrC
VLYVDAGGTLPTDPRAVPYTRFDRRSYPWIDDPLGLDSV